MRAPSGAFASSVAAVIPIAAAAVSAEAMAQQSGDLTTVPPVPRTYHPSTTPWGEPDLRANTRTCFAPTVTSPGSRPSPG